MTSPATARARAADPAPAASCDAFLDGRFRAYQPRQGPRAGIDALFLAAAVPAVAGQAQTVLEAGLGSGVASLALAARVGDVRITGVEVQPGLCALARRNAALNGMEERVTAVEADLTAASKTLREAGLEPESYDHVFANPPYLASGEARLPAESASARAHAAEPEALERWARFLAGMAAPGGTATLIHRAEALDRLLAVLKPRFGGLRVFPLFPREGEPARRVIVQGVKASRAPLVLTRGLVLHGEDGAYTPEAEAVLRGAEGLGIASAPAG